jgi:hypothetical protein
MRPYASVEAFLREERQTLSPTGVTLIGAPQRPRGVVIRFEVTLQDGRPLLRGEGRVLSFRAATDDGPSELSLKFTRLDSKSKALVDRAGSFHETEMAPPPLPEESTASDTEAPPPQDPLASTMIGATIPAGADLAPASRDDIIVASSSGSLPIIDVEEGGVPPSSGPLDAARKRDLLTKLRDRAKTLSPPAVSAILAAGRRSS